MRLVKGEADLAAMRGAAAITAEAHVRAMVAARPFAAAAHRGGTLTEVTSSLPQLDPVHDISVATPALAGPPLRGASSTAMPRESKYW